MSDENKSESPKADFHFRDNGELVFSDPEGRERVILEPTAVDRLRRFLGENQP
jgi:hypothetical protein